MIQTRGLTKDFVVSKAQTVHAVRGIDLDIAPGELVAVLGPNGAGKTTTMRMLTTLIRPTGGTATVAGVDVVQDPATVRRHIGYVGQGNGAGHNQRGVDELYSQGLIYGFDRASARRRAHELVEALELSAHANRKVSELSGGQRRRLDVALGLVHAPQLLFLDEPTTGLDPHNRANLWEHIVRLRAEHEMTIMLTTHYLDEADTMAERVLVMDHGRVIADDTAPRLKASLGDRVVVTVTAPDVAVPIAHRAPGARGVEVDGSRITLRVGDGPAVLPGLLRALDAAGAGTRTATVAQPTLDDVFLSLTGRSLREAGAASAATAPGTPKES